MGVVVAGVPSSVAPFGGEGVRSATPPRDPPGLKKVAFNPPWLLAPRRPHGAGARTTRGGAYHQPGEIAGPSCSRSLVGTHLSHPLRWLRCVCIRRHLRCGLLTQKRAPGR